jgi:hypothetical protein
MNQTGIQLKKVKFRVSFRGLPEFFEVPVLPSVSKSPLLGAFSGILSSLMKNLRKDFTSSDIDQVELQTLSRDAGKR